ncbi:MAG: hypothetical protein JSS02_05840 [Planctomycetes bacterium]|nr:hypothetical protein [Planctomycetota bacterium]
MVANYQLVTRMARCVGGMLVMALILLGLTSAGVADGKTPRVYAESSDNTGLIAAPLVYRDAILIVVTDDGVAAIEFRDKDAKLVNKSAKYRFRYLKDARSEEVAGAGIVHDSGNDIEECTIKAGPIRVGWSGRSADRGCIYYQPEEMQICIAEASRFEDSAAHPVPGESQLIQKLDLKRFLKKQK